ncbi:MAG: NifU family protein [Planctomycetes bacterium]|nr:NifU family protein [Planctomycetota bacterium]
MQDRVNIQLAAPSPGDETVRITLDRKVSPGGSVYFTDPLDARGWPLIEQLFQVDSVHSVLARENVLVVARKPGADWSALAPAVEKAIRDHYDAHPDADERLSPTPGAADEDAIRRQVEEILEEEINPGIAGHGGFIRLVDVQGSRVFLQMGGGCQGCGMARVTLRDGVERLLRARIPEITEILDATDHGSGASPYYSRGQ